MSGQAIRIILLVILAVGILVLSLLPETPLSVTYLMGLDKVQHWLAYTCLGFLVLLTIQGRKGVLLLYFGLSVFACTMYGGLIEVLQGFTGRNPDIADFFVNMFGASAGGVLAIGFIEISRSRSQKQAARDESDIEGNADGLD
ncbi:MAG: VanZ family protein [Spirochaetales bacterium]|jgi:VanZ family protein|nr:VanZ family protein [Spirochaetales bacterium]